MIILLPNACRVYMIIFVLVTSAKKNMNINFEKCFQLIFIVTEIIDSEGKHRDPHIFDFFRISK